MKVPSFYIETEFDAWLHSSSNKVSGEFSEYAKQYGRCELKHFENIHEYALYRFSNDLDNIGGDVVEMLGIDLQ